jgi:mannose-6-phosphate isomerase-like protein (cupin superfamily)
LAVPADGGESVFLVGDTYTTLLSGVQTGGVFTLLEALVLPEAGPPLHVHHGEEETFFLLHGHMVFTVGGETYHADPGAAIYVPRNVAHSYRDVGECPAKMLFMYSSAGMEAIAAPTATPSQSSMRASTTAPSGSAFTATATRLTTKAPPPILAALRGRAWPCNCPRRW